MVLGSLDTFLEGASTNLRLGRLAANAGMLRGLLEAGSFRELQLFCPSMEERKCLEQNLADWLPQNLRQRLRLRLQVELPQALSAGDVDLFHSAGWGRYLPGLARLRARFGKRRTPLTGTIHSLNEPGMEAWLRQFLSAPFVPCDAILCSSTAGMTAFARQIEHAGGGYRGRLAQLPLGIPETLFAGPAREDARRRLGWKAQDIAILWFGRLSASTKADLGPLLYAFRRLHKKVPAARLVLAGGDDPGSRHAYMEMIAELGIAENVTVFADPTDSQRADLYYGSDIFVSPVDNHQETFGLSVVEAMAAGLPCVVSDWDGYKDLVVDGETGFLVSTWTLPPPDEIAGLKEILDPPLAQLSLSQAVAVDLQELSDRLLRLCEDPGMRRCMGRSGRQRAVQEFSWRAVVPRMETLWEELLRDASTDGFGHPGAVPWGWDPRSFDTYPTDFLGDGSTLTLSTDALEILSGHLPMPATWTDLLPLSDGGLMTWIVRELKREEALTFLQLRSRAKSAFAKEDGEIGRMVLWLLKYGLLELK